MTLNHSVSHDDLDCPVDGGCFSVQVRVRGSCTQVVRDTLGARDLWIALDGVYPDPSPDLDLCPDRNLDSGGRVWSLVPYHGLVLAPVHCDLSHDDGYDHDQRNGECNPYP